MSYARRAARSRRFSLGLPRDVTICAGGERVLFLRSRAGDDPVTDLWQWTPEGEQRILSASDLALDDGAATDAELAQRERRRESAEGITSYATDADGTFVATALEGRLVMLDVAAGQVVVDQIARGVFDPQPDPDGRQVAYVADGALYVLTRDGAPRLIVEEDGVDWGVADFVAAEEMHRFRGFWWSPDGARLAACRVDERDVPQWYIADPSHPDARPRPHRYPAAGTTNPDVSLAIFEVDGDGRVDVDWDREGFPYLARVVWDEDRPLTLLVQDRHQRRWQVLEVDDTSGATTVAADGEDAAWFELLPGIPAWTADGHLVMIVDRPDLGDAGTRVVTIDGEPVTPPDLQVTAILAVQDDGLWFGAFADAFDVAVHRLDLTTGDVELVVGGEAVHTVQLRDDTVVVSSDRTEGPPTTIVRAEGGAGVALTTDVLDPGVEPAPRFLRLGPRRIPSALLLPSEGHDGPLPVLLSPYGGPGGPSRDRPAGLRRVIRSWSAFLEAQWFADQGFAVLVVDNRGMPGVDVRFEKAVSGDLASGPLEDQVEALHAAAEVEPFLDLDRVAIRGWSFGGYLAALALLRRPDVFRVGIAGAPVTDWTLYDTHYTERYLGLPGEASDAYRRSSLVDADGELIEPGEWDGHHRLLIIHGMADDNVVAAHSLRLSSALFAAGRDHVFLPLTNVTHMTPQEVVAENLLELQLRFLREALQDPGP